MRRPHIPGPAGPARSPSPGIARSASAAASSKDDDVIGSGRLPSTRAPFQEPAVLAARCSRARGHCDPATARFHPRSAPRRERRRARPRLAHAACGIAAFGIVNRAGPDAARRLLQPKQPASTTTESTDPHHLAPALTRFTRCASSHAARFTRPSASRACALARPGPQSDPGSWNRGFHLEVR